MQVAVPYCSYSLFGGPKIYKEKKSTEFATKNDFFEGLDKIPKNKKP